jgi:hypothetical protein
MRSLLSLVMLGCLFPVMVIAKEETEAEAIERFTRILNAKSSVDVIELPLSRICSDLAKRHAIPITFDPKGLKEVGASPQTLVSMKLDKLPLSTVLETILDPMKLRYNVTPTGLVITAKPKPPK